MGATLHSSVMGEGHCEADRGEKNKQMRRNEINSQGKILWMMFSKGIICKLGNVSWDRES